MVSLIWIRKEGCIMRKIVVMLIITVLFGAFATISAFSSQCSLGGRAGTAEGEIINTTCPIMGDKVDNSTPHKAVYKGKTIGFCCGGCVSMFNKEPERYIKKLEENQ